MDAGKWREKAEKFVSWAEARLQKNAEQLAWLAARGISAEAAREYRLGYNPGERGSAPDAQATHLTGRRQSKRGCRKCIIKCVSGSSLIPV